MAEIVPKIFVFELEDKNEVVDCYQGIIKRGSILKRSIQSKNLILTYNHDTKERILTEITFD